jgi:PHD/YefM family antitoxin component YafN of YafNO toxin-antitoxin module
MEFVMNIRPSAVIRNNYNEISNFCKKTKEPVYLTKNGEGDLVVMDIGSFVKRELMLNLRENLIIAEEERLSGKQGYSINEIDSMMKDAIRNSSGA